jgi:hypothetical protein
MSISLFRIETHTSQPIRVKDTELHVRSQAIQLRIPVANGGLIRNRPVAVLVRTWDGQGQILPIPDLTRIAVLTLVGLCFGCMFLLILLKRKKIES